MTDTTLETAANSGDDLFYDPYDYQVDIDAQKIWKRLRDEAPLYWNEKFGFYALSRFDDVWQATLDVETYSSAHGTTLEIMTDEPQKVPLMIWMDPPEHTWHRRIVNRAFTPRAMSGLEDRLARLCAELLDPLVGTGGFDYVDQFGALIPPTMILALLGFPESRANEWRLGIDQMFHHEKGGTGFSQETVASNEEDLISQGGSIGTGLLAMVPELLEDRRRNPREDLITVLASTEVDDKTGRRRGLTDAEIFGFVQLLAIAGTETVARLLSWVAVLLARNPDQLEDLATNPHLIANGIEELLRYEAPSPVNARWVTRDVELYGQVVPRGSKVILLNGSANRDDRHFPDPDRLDVRRPIDRHVSFGYGTHFCIGAALARLEARVALRETLKRFPMWEIDECQLEWVHTSTVRGFSKVPIRPR